MTLQSESPDPPDEDVYKNGGCQNDGGPWTKTMPREPPKVNNLALIQMTVEDNIFILNINKMYCIFRGNITPLCLAC